MRLCEGTATHSDVSGSDSALGPEPPGQRAVERSGRNAFLSIKGKDVLTEWLTFSSRLWTLGLVSLFSDACSSSDFRGHAESFCFMQSLPFTFWTYASFIAVFLQFTIWLWVSCFPGILLKIEGFQSTHLNLLRLRKVFFKLKYIVSYCFYWNALIHPQEHINWLNFFSSLHHINKWMCVYIHISVHIHTQMYTHTHVWMYNCKLLWFSIEYHLIFHLYYLFFLLILRELFCCLLRHWFDVP